MAANSEIGHNNSLLNIQLTQFWKKEADAHDPIVDFRIHKVKAPSTLLSPTTTINSLAYTPIQLMENQSRHGFACDLRKGF